MMERFKRLSTYKVQNKIALKQNIMDLFNGNNSEKVSHQTNYMSCIRTNKPSDL